MGVLKESDFVRRDFAIDYGNLLAQQRQYPVVYRELIREVSEINKTLTETDLKERIVTCKQKAIEKVSIIASHLNDKYVDIIMAVLLLRAMEVRE